MLPSAFLVGEGRMSGGVEAHDEVDPRLLEPGKEPTVAEFPIKNQGPFAQKLLHLEEGPEMHQVPGGFLSGDGAG